MAQPVDPMHEKSSGPESRTVRGIHEVRQTGYDAHPPSRTQGARVSLQNPATALNSLRREFGDELAGLLSRLRFIVLPLPLLVGGFVIVMDHALWRRMTIATALLFAAALVGSYSARAVKFDFPAPQPLIFVGVVIHPALLIATGGVFSPLILAMLIVAYTSGAMFERVKSLGVVSAQVCAIFLAASLDYTQLIGPLIPAPFNPSRISGEHSAWPFVMATLAGFIFLAASEIGYRLQRITLRLVQKEVEAKEESLRMHHEQLTELTLLSGEIAHELKNPLASIKGLGALLARRLQGQELEPLGVLRREADRMQGILDEFLNLSRPLVPLNLAPRELRPIVLDVCAMHQGLAELRNIRLEVTNAPDTRVICDERKLRQILVNLVQNALDASPDGERIVISFALEDERIELTIDDAGAGLDPQLRDRVFEAGVTTKQGGSGLGLNVARGLARQHGGDVSLADRPGRGCRATLTLPRRTNPRKSENDSK